MLKRIDRKEFDSHAYSVNKLYWGDFKDYLVTASDDRKIMVWDVKEVGSDSNYDCNVDS